MRKLIFPIFFILGVMGVLSLRSSQAPETERSIVVFPSGIEVMVDVADEHAERVQGLSGREYLEERDGLLFLHETREVQRYWMKEMNFPIDIIWLFEGEVIGFVEDAQPEDPVVTIYTSPAPVDAVLEVSAGFINSHSVKMGDILDIRVVSQ